MRIINHLWPLIILLAAIIVTSCTKDRAIHEFIDFEIIETIDIQAGVNHKLSTPILFECDSSTLIIALDTHNQGIDVYDLQKRAYAKRIHLHDDGPNKVLDSRALSIHNLDSIFVLNDINHLYLVDQYGTKKGHWNLNITLPDSLLGINPDLSGEFIIAAYSKPDFLNLPFSFSQTGGSIIARIIPLTSPYVKNKYTTIYKTPNMIELDLSTSSIREVFGRYPNVYQLNRKPHNPFSHYTHVKNDIWIHFDSSDEIYSVERDTFFLAPSLMSSNEITKFRDEDRPSEEEEFRSYHTDEAYIGIYYDPYNELVYRVFQHFQLDKGPDGSLNQKMQAPFSILVMNTNGEILGEALFEKEKYNFLDMLITKRGVLISKENPFNTENSEDIHSFDLVKFKL